MLDWLEARLGEVFRGEVEASPLGQVTRTFNAYMNLFAHYPAVPRLFFSDTFHHPYPRLHERLQALVRNCEGQLANWLVQAAARGEVNTSLPAPAAAKLLLTCIQGLAFQSCVLGIVSDPIKAGRSILPLYLSAIGADKS